MANITITVSTAQAATIDRNEYANTTAFVQAKMDGVFAGRIRRPLSAIGHDRSACQDCSSGIAA